MTERLNLASIITCLGSGGLFFAIFITNKDVVYLTITGSITLIYLLIPILHHFNQENKTKYYFAIVLPVWYVVTMVCIGGFFSQSIATAATLSITYVLFNKKTKIRNYLFGYNILIFIIANIYLIFYPPIFGIRDYPFDELVVFLISLGWISLVFQHHENEKLAFIQRLEEKNQILQDTSNELERFNQIASHDLKAPLRTIISFTDLIERNIKRGEVNQAIQDLNFIKSSSQQMNVLVEGILEISRVNNKQTKRSLVDLNQLMKKVKSNLLADIEEKSALINIQLLPKYFCNEVEFILLFQNLIQNGLKYNKSDKPIITISSEQKKGKLFIRIKDNGIGIEEQYYEKIFEHFKRLHTQNDYKGTGLGLALVKKIVAQHKGNISVKSTIDQGSIFTISLPK